MKTHWRKLHNLNYIGSWAFQPDERKVVTIKSIQQEEVKNERGSDDCLVVHFKEDEKPLICNVTNSKAIEKVSGSPYIEDWVNTKIELYLESVRAFGTTTDAVRVKPTPPKTTKPELTQSHPAYAKVMEAVANGYEREQVEKKYTVSDEVWNQLVDGEVL